MVPRGCWKGHSHITSQHCLMAKNLPKNQLPIRVLVKFHPSPSVAGQAREERGQLACTPKHTHCSGTTCPMDRTEHLLEEVLV